MTDPAPAARGPVRRALAALDAGLAAFERGLIVVLLAVMAGAVFLDALHRLFAADEGRIERLLVALAPATLEPVARRILAPALLAFITFVACYFAGKARNERAGRLRLNAQALLLTAALAGATQLLVWLLPSGLIWSQQMALCFMLWLALAGASLGAREHAHLAFELAGKIWPAPLRRPVELLARVIAALFTLLLAVLAAAHAREHYLEWASSDGTAGIFEAFRVPRFLIFGFLPLPLAVLALRFAAHGVRPAETK